MVELWLEKYLFQVAAGVNFREKRLEATWLGYWCIRWWVEHRGTPKFWFRKAIICSKWFESWLVFHFAQKHPKRLLSIMANLMFSKVAQFLFGVPPILFERHSLVSYLGNSLNWSPYSVFDKPWDVFLETHQFVTTKTVIFLDLWGWNLVQHH